MERSEIITNIIAIIMVIFLVSCFSFIMYSSTQQVKYETLACQNLGFINISYDFRQPTCEDYEGNLHYVKMTDQYGGIFNLFIVNATAKEISVGGVRVTE